MKIIGVTGGIASGKSTVTRIIIDNDIPVIDADAINHHLQKVGSECLGVIAEKFGSNIINNDGSLNRKLLGSIVFNDPGKMKELEAIMHPRINSKIFASIDHFRKNGESIVFVDNSLLIETDWYKNVDQVWVVSVNKNTQLERLIRRNGYSQEEAQKRISAQMSVDEKIKYANVVIDNNGSLENTRLQVEKFIYELMNT